MSKPILDHTPEVKPAAVCMFVVIAIVAGIAIAALAIHKVM